MPLRDDSSTSSLEYLERYFQYSHTRFFPWSPHNCIHCTVLMQSCHFYKFIFTGLYCKHFGGWLQGTKWGRIFSLFCFQITVVVIIVYPLPRIPINLMRFTSSYVCVPRLALRLKSMLLPYLPLFNYQRLTDQLPFQKLKYVVTGLQDWIQWCTIVILFLADSLLAVWCF